MILKKLNLIFDWRIVVAKIHSIYPHAKMTCCPAKWVHYMEIEDAPLVLMESEHKHPGELFFDFCGLRSSMITNLETVQETIEDVVAVEITTHKGEHYYYFEVWYDM